MATGAIAANLHTGSRSEYLAQYVFSAHGTCVAVPHQEDHGIDLHCTLTTPEGQRAWPVAYYSVQVKSNDDPWKFDRPESVDWLLNYPVPLLLCVIDKREARINVYQTAGRLRPRTVIDPPDTMTLIPGAVAAEATPMPDSDYAAGIVQLGAPILSFTVAELLDKRNFDIFREVLDFWVDLDLDNIRRLQSGIRSVWIPGPYSTNKIPKVPKEGATRYFLNYGTPEIRARAEVTCLEVLETLAPLMLNDDDRVGALLAALMMRHHDRRSGEREKAKLRPDIRDRIIKVCGLDSGNYVFAPYDSILDDLRSRCADEHDDDAR